MRSPIAGALLYLGAELPRHSLSAWASRHRVFVGLELLAQLYARVTQLDKLGPLSPLPHRLLVLKSPNRDKSPGLGVVPK
jgi:hypothetical protein